MWKRWHGWAIRSRLEPIKRVARHDPEALGGVLHAAISNVTNALSEGLNRKIQWIKRKACGYRNRAQFRQAIYFHRGGRISTPLRYPRATRKPKTARNS